MNLDVVSSHLPALLNLDVLDAHLLTPDTVFNSLVKKSIVNNNHGKIHAVETWSVPLTRADDHVYADIDKPAEVFLTRPELSKLHRQIVHPSTDELLKILWKASPEDTTPETLSTLEHLTKRCDPCQRIQNATVRFRVCLGTE